jgi:glutathione S-transferase
VSQIRLYSYDACPFARRTRMVLAEKSIDFTLEAIDVHNKPEGWSEISPSGKVPLLRHRNTSIYESSIINQYLDELFPDPPLAQRYV